MIGSGLDPNSMCTSRTYPTQALDRHISNPRTLLQVVEGEALDRVVAAGDHLGALVDRPGGQAALVGPGHLVELHGAVGDDQVENPVRVVGVGQDQEEAVVGIGVGAAVEAEHVTPELQRQ